MSSQTQHPYTKLKPYQLDILLSLYKFRFGTTELLLSTSHKHITSRAMRKRLAILHEQKYIDKRVPTKTSFGNQYSMYCLTLKGISELKVREIGSSAALRNIRKDIQASNRFARHCIGIFGVANELCASYSERCLFLTRTFLYGKEYWPNPLPDAHVIIQDAQGAFRQQYLFEYIDDTKPQRIWKQRINQLIEYLDNGEWPEIGGEPTLLLVCASGRLEQNTRAWVKRALEENYITDMTVLISTTEYVVSTIQHAGHAKSPEAA